MPIADYPYSFLRGLSDFWTRFFADADQLDAMYKGTAIQVGQAYLDLMSTVLGVALKDAIVFDREHYRLITIREDEVAYVEGATSPDDRWAFALPDPVVSFAMLDNRVVEPTASLEPNLDYEVVNRVVQFHVDPTSPLGDGVPLAGYARRALDVEVGGTFTDASSIDWTLYIKKGDTLRVLDIGTDGTQRKRADYPIVVVRPAALYVAASTPFPPATAVPATVTYVIVRQSATPAVIAESFTLAANKATLTHTRLDVGSVRVYAKAPGGQDVVEGVDYLINYEQGSIVALTAWAGIVGGAGTFACAYTWREEVYPTFGVSPRSALTGSIAALAGTTRVLQIALWAPDTLVDRRTLANNFGSFINRMQSSSEAYRAFLSGIFQLYVLGPVLQRIESALNVVLGLPVVRDDGELYQSTDTSDPLVDRVLTTRPSTGQTAVYVFPKGTPFRTDFVVGLVFQSFETLTTIVTVTDYVQTPQWWHGEVIPKELLLNSDGTVPPVYRRTASAAYIANVINPSDGACIGDPGLYIGADEEGVVPEPRTELGVLLPPLRRRLAFVLMDRYLKYHVFSVRFDAFAAATVAGSGLLQSLTDLNELVLSARPSHTFPFTTPTTAFRDEIEVSEGVIFLGRLLGSRVYGPDKVLFTDATPTIGEGVWNIGDYFKYELFTASVAFPVISTPVTLPSAPGAPRRRRLVLVHVAGDVAGVSLVENRDYTVNYASCTVTRLTAWTVTTVNVTFRQLNIGNLVDAAPGTGDMPVLVNGVDPALVTGAFNPAAAGWDGVVTPTTAPQDIGMVERALIVNPHP